LADEIKVLQLGNDNWEQIYPIHKNVKYYYEPNFEEISEILFDVVFIDRIISEEECKVLYQVTKAYTLFVTEDIEDRDELSWLIKSKKGKSIKKNELASFLANSIKYYFSAPYGEKQHQDNIAVSQGFNGSVRWNGQYAVELEADYGSTFRQVLYYRFNAAIFAGQSIEFWPEYEKDPGVEIQLSVVKLSVNRFDEVELRWIFTEDDLKKIVTIENNDTRGYLFFSIMAKGKGKLKWIALHDRYSRNGNGFFLPGGEISLTSKREEVFSYFDPMDMKPPLCVYFSGFKTKEGFEGYYMMRSLGKPYLLIGEPRLLGGCCYMGDDEYEQLVVDTIEKYRKELGFSSSEVILSGLSMGTTGALYYSPNIHPGAVVIGKPLTNYGDIAKNGKIKRPKDFSTAFDMLKYLTGSTDEEAVKKLNDRFWNKFRKARLKKTQFAIAYMIEDDYDDQAYNMLISNLQEEGIVVYGKGLHGRHNDNSAGINSWFISQYRRIIRDNFGRVEE